MLRSDSHDVHNYSRRSRAGQRTARGGRGNAAPRPAEVRTFDQRTAKDLDLRNAVARLLSTEDAELAIGEVVGLGSQAIPALRRLLHAPDPAGLFERRRRAVRALAELGADGVLIGYISAPPEPVGGAGQASELAVINAATWALRLRRDPRAFAPLLKLALRWRAKGAIEALAEFDWPQAVPGLVAGLYGDESRSVAEAALARRGRAAAPILIETVRRAPWRSAAAAARLRARRAAARILSRIELSSRHLREFGRLIHDPDPDVSACACLAILNDGVVGPVGPARARLAELSPRLQLPLRKQAETILAAAAPMAAARCEAQP